MALLLPTSSPSAQGVDAAGVLALVEALESDGHDPHSLVLARHGSVVARGWWAPYSADRVQLVYSLSKSFTATAVGALVDDGRLALDDRVFDLLPAAQLPAGAEVSERYRRVTVRHCLTMATGHDVDGWRPTVSRAAFTRSDDGTDPVLGALLAVEPEHEPGTAWAYNQVATYLLGAVVREVTGRSLLDVVRDRVLAPLDPEGLADVAWHTTMTGRELGFSGLHVGSDAILGLSQTYLDSGRWHGATLVSPEWVATATSPTGLPNREPDPNPDWCEGYGCSFWGARHGYRGDGAYGQYAIVLPEQDVALAITSETVDMQAVLDLVWEHLLPALDRDGEAGADEELDRRMGSLRAPLPAATEPGPSTATWATGAGTVSDRYRVTGLERDGDGWRLDVEGLAAPLRVGERAWVESDWQVDDVRLPVVAAGGWTRDDRFRADLRLVETPHRILLDASVRGTARLDWREVPLMGDDPAVLAVRRANTR